MFAIVEACGRQYKLEPGRFIDIDLTSGEEGSSHVFDKVMMLVDGTEATIGQPYVEGALVTGKVVSKMVENPATGDMDSSIKSKKVIVYHMRPKKGTRKKQGHRQQFTRVFIDSIALDGKEIAKAERVEKPAKAEAKPAKQEKPSKAEKEADSKPAKAAKADKADKPAKTTEKKDKAKKE